jgi:hypothetical protein
MFNRLGIYLFDYSGTVFLANKMKIRDYLSQMLEVGRFYECLHFADSVQILNGKYK